METLNTEFALYGSKNKSTRTYTVFIPLSKVCKEAVFLGNSHFSSLWHFGLGFGIYCMAGRLEKAES